MNNTITYIPAIGSEAEYDIAQKRAIELVRKSDKTNEEKKEFHALSILIKDWESNNLPSLEEFDPVDYILFVMEQRGLRHTDMIPFFGASSRVSEVLNRKKPLTLKVIRNLHKELSIPLSILIKEVRLEKMAS